MLILLLFGALGTGAIKNDVAPVYAMLSIARDQSAPGPLGNSDIDDPFAGLAAQMIMRLDVPVKSVGGIRNMNLPYNA